MLDCNIICTQIKIKIEQFMLQFNNSLSKLIFAGILKLKIFLNISLFEQTNNVITVLPDL